MEPLVTTLLDHLPVIVSSDFRAHSVDKVIAVTVVIYCDRYVILATLQQKQVSKKSLNTPSAAVALWQSGCPVNVRSWVRSRKMEYSLLLQLVARATVHDVRNQTVQRLWLYRALENTRHCSSNVCSNGTETQRARVCSVDCVPFE